MKCPHCHCTLQNDQLGVLRCYNAACEWYACTAQVPQPIDEPKVEESGA